MENEEKRQGRKGVQKGEKSERSGADGRTDGRGRAMNEMRLGRSPAKTECSFAAAGLAGRGKIPRRAREKGKPPGLAGISATHVVQLSRSMLIWHRNIDVMDRENDQWCNSQVKGRKGARVDGVCLLRFLFLSRSKFAEPLVPKALHV